MRTLALVTFAEGTHRFCDVEEYCRLDERTVVAVLLVRFGLPVEHPATRPA